MKKVVILLAFFLLVTLGASCKKGYPSERKVFSLVIDNEETLLTAIRELQKIETGNTFTYISTTYKSPIYTYGRENYDDISGLYTAKYVDGDYIYTAIDNAAIEEMMKIKGLISVYVYNDRIEFDYKGHGGFFSSAYCGFIYTERDNFIDFENPNVTKEGNGWLWRQENSDNSYYKEEIIDYFYYYEARY